MYLNTILQSGRGDRPKTSTGYRQMDSAREISLKWNKPHHRSEELFNVPLNQIVKLRLQIEARSGASFFVTMSHSGSSWLSLSRTVGKVPYQITVTVDTTGLQEGQGYKDVLEFRSRGETIYLEPVYLTTQVYDPGQLATQPYGFPLNPGKPRRNPLRTIWYGLAVVYHFIMAAIYLWVGLFIITLVLGIILAAFNT